MQRTEKLSWTGIVFMAIAAFSLAMFMTAAPAQAAVDCSAATSQDTDGDGYTDADECAGITLLDGTAVPNCSNGTGAVGCLDPDTADIFVLLVPATDPLAGSQAYSLLPDNPFMYLNIGATAHQITSAQVNLTRLITSNQRTVRLTESLDYSMGELGRAQYGTPDQSFVIGTIFTKNIKDYIDLICPDIDPDTNEPSVCVDADGTTADKASIIDKYIRHTIAHEISHMVLVKQVDDRTLNKIGHHSPGGTGFLMDQFVAYTDKKGVVTTYITTEHSADDMANVTLHR